MKEAKNNGNGGKGEGVDHVEREGSKPSLSRFAKQLMIASVSKSLTLRLMAEGDQSGLAGPGLQILQKLREKTVHLGEILVVASRGRPQFIAFSNPTAARLFQVPLVKSGDSPAPWGSVPKNIATYLANAIGSTDGDEQREMPLMEIEGPPVRAFSVDVRAQEHEGSGRSWHYFSFVEVTSWLNLQEEVMNSRRMESIGTLASGIAHDFNNLIMAVQGHAEFLQMRGNLDEVTSESLERIIRSCVNGTELTRSLLGFARQQKLSMDSITVGALVKDVSALCERTFGPRIKFVIDPTLIPKTGRDPYRINGCYSALSHCLLNIFNNARDAMADGGTLTVSAAVEGGKIELSIHDSGSGISRENLGRIFDPFFTTKGVGKGTGLGLSMVQGIMQQHGGGIAVESEVGKGTTVSLWWPALEGEGDESEMQPSVASGPMPRPGAMRTAFLIEDEPLVMSSISRLLQQNNHQVEMFLSAKDALERIKAGDRPETIVCDYSMPEMDGIEFIKQSIGVLTDSGSEARVRFILVSGFPPEHFDELVKEVRHVTIHLLQKPFSSQTLLKLLSTPLKKFQRRITSRVKVDSHGLKAARENAGLQESPSESGTGS